MKDLYYTTNYVLLVFTKPDKKAIYDHPNIYGYDIVQQTNLTLKHNFCLLSMVLDILGNMHTDNAILHDR